MTDRHAGYLVTLDKDIREDDAESIMIAIRSLRRVIDVRPAPVDGMDIQMAKNRLRTELGNKIIDLIYKETI